MNHTSTGPLEGLQILDCSTLLPGPFVGKLLSNLGAKVIKIENPDRPDAARQMGAFYPELNDCKKLVWLNLTVEKDQEQFKALVKSSDGLIEGFRPNAKLKLGLDQKSLLSTNPKLCIASLTGYPEEGPFKNRAGHDLNFEALSGCLSMYNDMPAVPLADFFGAYSAALRLTALLLKAKATGQGGRIEISLFEALKEAQGIWIREYSQSGHQPKHGETLMSGMHPCYQIYETQDQRRVAVGAIEHKFWVKVCEILGLPELQSLGMSRGEEAIPVVQKVSAAFKSKPWSYWSPRFEKADCCVEPVLEYSEVYKRDGIQS